MELPIHPLAVVNHRSYDALALRPAVFASRFSTVQYYLSRYDSEEEAHAVVRRALKEVMVSE